MTARDSQQLGQLIRRYRVAAALSQEELAERSGISARAVSDIERGLRTAPRLETVRMLADALKLDGPERVAVMAAARPEPVDPGIEPAIEPPGHDGARSSVVPLRLPPLPVPSTRLIGRESLVEETATLLRSGQSRLVTLTGPGGVGKTRLALAIAAEVASTFEDGAALVDCAPLTNAAQVPGAIASALDILIDAGTTPLASLRLSLRNRSLLLVLDNFEHLLDAAVQISELLTNCPRLVVIATSRSRLRVRGEHVVQVEPLEAPGSADDGLPVEDVARISAVQLFLERADDAAAGLELTSENARAICEICRRLDGLPLAIELAAARTPLLSPSALLTRLERRLGILTEGARDAPDRQQTLRNTISWSYDLLSPAEQAFFRRASLFVGGFTLEAAEAVAAEPGDDALAIVTSLLEKNLFRRQPASSGDNRFALLDTIQEFGLEQLAGSGDEESTRHRHFDWFLALCDQGDEALQSAVDEVLWFARLDDDAENLRLALQWQDEAGHAAAVVTLLAKAGFWYWTGRPYDLELHQMLERNLEQHPLLTPQILARAHFLATWLAGETGDWDQMLSSAAAGLEVVERTDDPFSIGVAHLTMGVAWEVAGDCERSIAAHRESMEACKRAPELRAFIAVAIAELGDKLIFCGNVDDGVQLIDEAIRINTELGSDNGLMMSCGQRGNAARIQGDVALARRMFARSVRHAERIGDRSFGLGAIVGLAGVELLEGHLEQAIRILGAVEAARESLGLRRYRHPLHSHQIIAEARRAAGNERFEQLIAEGRQMPYDQLLALSLDGW